MTKDTFYFSHDYNARNDIKIKKLIRKHRCLGYGIYWCLIEDLYNNANTLELDYDGIAFDLHTEPEIVKSIIHDFDLFVIEQNEFGSASIERRIDERNEKSSKASKNAYKRWGNDLSRGKSNKCIFYIINIFNDDESFIKCGITNESISRRYSGKLKNYSYSVIYSIDTDLPIALNIETSIQKQFKNYIPKNKFGGYFDCYNIDDKNEILNIAMQSESDGITIISKGYEKEKAVKNNEMDEFIEFRKNEIEMYHADIYDKLKKYDITTPIVYAGKKIPVVYYDLVEIVEESINHDEWKKNLKSRFGKIKFDDALKDFIKTIKTTYDYFKYETSNDFKKHFSNWLQINLKTYL